MPKAPRTEAAYSRVSVKSQTVIPRSVREKLKFAPGDRVRYRMTANGVLIDKASAVDVEWSRSLNPTLCEWSTPEDHAAYDEL